MKARLQKQTEHSKQLVETKHQRILYRQCVKLGNGLEC